MYTIWLMFPRVRLSLDLEDFNPINPFGMLDPLIEHGSARDLQEDTQMHSEAMFAKQAQHDKDMFGLESGFITSTAKDQYNRQRALLQDSPGLQMKGLKSAGLNPILAATGGFKSSAGGAMPVPAARASSSAKGEGGGSSGARSNNYSMVAQANAKYLYEQAALTSAQKAKTLAETKKIQSEQPKKDFFEFFWNKFNGDIRNFDNAFSKWADENGKIMNELIDTLGSTFEQIKQEFKEYVDTKFDRSKRGLPEGKTGRNK